jgi:hypothetical protein
LDFHANENELTGTCLVWDQQQRIAKNVQFFCRIDYVDTCSVAHIHIANIGFTRAWLFQKLNLSMVIEWINLLPLFLD